MGILAGRDLGNITTHYHDMEESLNDRYVVLALLPTPDDCDREWWFRYPLYTLICKIPGAA